MNLDDLTLGEIRQLKAMLGGGSVPAIAPSENHGRCIIVATQGFVYVGDVITDGTYHNVTNGANVRRWGTSRGLGELAEKGPQAESKLDPCPLTKIPNASVVSIIKCSEKWNAWKP